jgi:antitoxin YefM
MCNNLYNIKEAAMVDVTTYSEARQNLAKLLDRVVKDNEPVIVARKKRGSVVLVALSEWNSIQETLHLFSTRANARALLDAMDDLDAGKGIEMTMDELNDFVKRAQKGKTPPMPGRRRKPARRPVAGKIRRTNARPEAAE